MNSNMRPPNFQQNAKKFSSKGTLSIILMIDSWTAKKKKKKKKRKERSMNWMVSLFISVKVYTNETNWNGSFLQNSTSQ